MKRNLEILANEKFDVIVIGGGIYGAFVAWDSALRGLSVVLIEKEDFGHATSSNSLKIIHGGLRYLQDVNLNRARTMAVEKSTWLLHAIYVKFSFLQVLFFNRHIQL